MGEEDKFLIAGQFNTAGYQMMRLHERFLGIDRLSLYPLDLNSDFGVYNYKLIFSELCSIFSTIFPKLTRGEKNKTIEIKSFIEDFMETDPVHKKTKTQEVFYPLRWNFLNRSLFSFRLELERLMDIHGIGNPSKQDPRRAVIEQ